MKTSRGGWISRSVVAVAILAWGGAGTAWATDFTWDGNGNPNNGGSWSTANNWNWDSGYPQTGDDNATLPAATATGRSITVDVAVVVNNLTWPASSAANTLRLDANLTVTNTLSSSQGNNTLNVNGRTLTLNSSSDQQSPVFTGSGRIVKQGTGTFVLGFDNRVHPFSGEIIVSNGIARAINYGGDFRTCTNVTVASSGGTSGTFQFNGGSTPSYLPQRYTIAGPGYNNQGALLWTQGNTGGNAFTKPVTVQADATISISSGQTVEYTGTLSGSGTLTLIGGGHLKIMNGAATHDGMIVVTNATLSVPGALPSVTNITILAGGVLNGSQAHFPLATVVNNGGTWNDVDTASTWSGLGDNATWSEAANWFGDVPVDIEAIIPATAVARTIVVDSPVQVSKLTWTGGGGGTDTIRLDNDMTVDQLDATSGVYLNVNGKTFTLGWNANTERTPRFSGAGQILKQGTNTFNMGPSHITQTFSGNIEVSNGTAVAPAYGGVFSSASLTVTSSEGKAGTFELAHHAPAQLPASFTINGPGFNNGGAMRHTSGTSPFGLTRNVTVASDASWHINATRIVEYGGTLGGSGTLTLIGGGHLKIMNGAATHDGMIVVSNGTLSVNGELPSVTNITILANGTLNGSQARFPSATVVNDSGTWNEVDTASTWSGLGDGTNWSHAANWYGDVPVDIEAIIPAATATRNIRVDSPASLSKLNWPGGGSSDTITLDDDLTVGQLDARAGGAVTLNVNGQTFFVDWNSSRDRTATFSGAGRIVKQGTGTFHMGPHSVSHPFSGSIVVSNGTAVLNNHDGVFSNCTNLTVTSSAGVSGTFSFSAGSTPNYLPLRFTINGPGYNNLGALRCLGTITLARPITVQSDATTFINSGVTLTHTGALDGSGVMTLTGGGTYTMSNAWTYTVNGATGNGIVVSTGTVDIAGCTLTVAGLETATASEYVLVDHSAATGNLVGSSFKDVIGLPETWSITYVGTTANPSAIVLSPPPRGTMIMLR